MDYLDSLNEKGQLSTKVVSAVRSLTGQGLFNVILKAARNGNISENDLDFLRSLNTQEPINTKDKTCQ